MEGYKGHRGFGHRQSWQDHTMLGKHKHDEEEAAPVPAVVEEEKPEAPVEEQQPKVEEPKPVVEEPKQEEPVTAPAPSVPEPPKKESKFKVKDMLDILLTVAGLFVKDDKSNKS